MRHDHQLDSTDLFTLVWTGWFWGVISIFAPFFLLAALVVLFTKPTDALDVLVGAFMLPLIGALQGIIAGALVVFGLWVHRQVARRRHFRSAA